MENQFFERPILNSPYEYPIRYWELDATGQPTQRIIENRRRAEFITPFESQLDARGCASLATVRMRSSRWFSGGG